jgi:hypothetical protein
VQTRHEDRHDYVPEKCRGLEIMAREVDVDVVEPWRAGGEIVPLP